MIQEGTWCAFQQVAGPGSVMIPFMVLGVEKEFPGCCPKTLLALSLTAIYDEGDILGPCCLVLSLHKTWQFSMRSHQHGHLKEV